MTEPSCDITEPRRDITEHSNFSVSFHFDIRMTDSDSGDMSEDQSSASCPLSGLPAIVAAHPPDANIDNWLTVEGGMV